MVNLFEIGVNVIEEIIIAVFLLRYLGSRYDGWKKYAGLASAIMVSVGTITFFNSLYIYEGILGLVFILIYFIYSLLFLKGDKYVKLFITGFINCIVYFIALFSTLCVSIIYGQRDYGMYGVGLERLTLIIMSKLLLVLACLILLRFRIKNVGGRKNLAMLVIMSIVVELSTVGMMQVFLQYSRLNAELLLASISVMAANILTYSIFIKINKDIKRETELRSLQQKYEYDKKHANEIEELYSKTCGIRHDLLTHFTILKGLLNESNDKAKEYIEAVTQNQFEEIKSFVKTGNASFDSIVNAKTAICEKLGIRVQIRVMSGSLGYLKQDEIGVLFGNLFDNAIEAAQNTQEKRIELDVQTQGAYLSIQMKNTINSSVLAYNKNLKTIKEDKSCHGFGTKNIRKIVDKYDGIISYFEENGFFFCDILL